MELIISSSLTLFIVVELILINIFKKDKQATLTGLVSLISVGFGIFLCVKYGLLLDYENEIEETSVMMHYYFGLVNLCTGLFSVGVSILKFVIWRFKLFVK